VYIDPAAVVIGDVVLGDDVSVWPTAVLRGDVHHIAVGPRSNIQDGAVLHVTHDGPYTPGGRALHVGEDVTVGHRVTLHACTVGDRCLIGIGSIVMDDAVIGDDVLLAAGSLVPPGAQLEPGSLYRGAPAKRVRALAAEEIARLSYSAAHYLEVKARYLRDEEGP
jgi:carbonic anhydrase/acetyltransferase-like protein (isoleucine patch superfamily)